jgi:hypothetical protein
VDTISDKSTDVDRLDDAHKLAQDPFINRANHTMLVVATCKIYFNVILPKLNFKLLIENSHFNVLLRTNSILAIFRARQQIIAVERELASWKYGDRLELVVGRFNRLNPGSIVQLNETQLIEQGMYEEGLRVNVEAFAVLGGVALQGRPFAITEDKKLFASVPSGTQVGDVVVMFNGAPAPFILRSAGDEDGCYYTVGEAYVNGIMHGEAVKDGKSRTFHIR